MTVHELLCIDFEQEMCGKHPTRFASPDGGSDPIVSEPTDGPIHTQCTHNPVWSRLTNGKGVEGQLIRSAPQSVCPTTRRMSRAF